MYLFGMSREISKSKNKEVQKSKDNNKGSRAFVMRLSDEDFEFDDHRDEKVIVGGRRFACAELFLSDNEDSDDDSVVGVETKLMPRASLVDRALSEITNDRQLAIMDKIRSHKMDLEMTLLNENEKFASNLANTEKNAERKRDRERNFDRQYQRKIAEALDTHLTAVQRDHEQKSQIEERRIIDAKVREEAQRKEREEREREEKRRQEKIKADSELQARVEAERAEAEKKAASLEAERKAAALEAKRKAEEAAQQQTSVLQSSLSQSTESVWRTGNLVKSTETAIKIEEKRLQMYDKVCADNRALQMSTNMDYNAHERNIKRNIRTMRGSQKSVSDKAEALLHLINQQSVPQSISIMMFVDMIVAQCNKPTDNRSLYAYGQLAVLVASQVPPVMDMLIAKLNRVCIYTVPKHISYSKSVFTTHEEYYNAIGFEQEEDGKIESVDSFIGRMTSCMKLYGAIVQTEVRRFQNLHGIEEGWAWLARFLNALPPNSYTAVALYSFIEMAGYALYKRFRNQFMKVLQIIERDYLDVLPEDLKSTTAMHNFRDYLRSKQFLNEPEERQLKTEVLSSAVEFY
ncbi:OLC1v1028462C1 [Oldenlandia corymbosa var. corymbosa]|uniref:mRNA export factor GLE1 n=1 Tax=Oldenlandia corymbosa var. corymbosa TaxID=529605 RepID=A0AAV1CBS9_OLDCO|nr:OLC1v1028462C1 [Oldenlandia corymbosa var. corymbosa]